MLAVGLSLVLFAYWWTVGYAVLAAARRQRNLRQTMLVAPAIGTAATVLPVFWLSRLGLPVARFGTGLAVALLVVALGALAWKRPVIPLRRLAPFGAVLLGALVLTGRPMGRFGFDWLSYANNDMGFYVLAAGRLLGHGFFDPPDAAALAGGLDYTLFTWFTDVQGGHRPGSQLLLAWVASATGLTPDQAFMPTTVALHLVLIGAVGALVCRSPRRQPAALATCVMLAVSPLVTLGTLYQLMAQVWGLGLIGALAATLWTPFPAGGLRRLVRFGVTPALAASALMVVYPETSPLVAAGLALYLGIARLRRPRTLASTLAVAATGGVLGVLALNFYLKDSIGYLLGILTARSAPSDPHAMLFYDYLIPSGLAALWGLQPIGHVVGEPWMSTTIVLGAVLLLGTLAGALVLAWRGEPIAILCLPMLALAGRTFALRHDFILFKLAMYLAPFLVGSLVLTLFTLVRRRAYRAAPLILLGVAGLWTQAAYVERSAGSGGWVEVVAGSRGGLVSQFRRLVAEAAPGRLELDTVNPVIARLQAAQVVGIPTAFSSGDFWQAVDFDKAPPPDSTASARLAGPERGDGTLAAVLEARRTWARFALMTPGDPDPYNTFVVAAPRWVRRPAEPCGFLGLTTGSQAVFNRRRLSADGKRAFVMAPCAAVQNHLVFVHSARGQHQYHARDARRISLYQLERDPLFHRDQTMAGIGRHLLLEIVNPTPRVRVAVHFTRSFAGDGDNRLPPAAVIGTERLPFSLVGRGSARVFSPPVAPQVVGGRPYVALDMGVDGSPFPDRRSVGLMRLYGRDIALDGRRLVAFTRDVSLVSEAEYRARRTPPALRAFPADLANPDVEYSGLYEDGWVSEAASVSLAAGGSPSMLVVRGTVPAVGDRAFETECIISVDGREVARRSIGVGRFSLTAPVDAVPERARIDLRFSRVQRLEAPDNRPVAARLDFLGFGE